MAVPDRAVSTLAGVSSVYIRQGRQDTQQAVTLGVRQANLWETSTLEGRRDARGQQVERAGHGVSIESTRIASVVVGRAPRRRQERQGGGKGKRAGGS